MTCDCKEDVDDDQGLKHDELLHKNIGLRAETISQLVNRQKSNR